MHKIEFFLPVIMVLTAISGLYAAQSQKTTVVDLKTEYEARRVTLIIPQSDPSPASLWYGINYGFKPIEEPTFLHIAGYEKEAGDSSANLFWKNVIIWTGGLCFLGGCAYEIGGTFASLSRNDNNFLTPILIGGGMQLGGVITLEIGFFRPPNTQPLGRAQQIMSEYNDKLMDEISSSNR